MTKEGCLYPSLDSNSLGNLEKYKLVKSSHSFWVVGGGATSICGGGYEGDEDLNVTSKTQMDC